jgi:hypothetical protein
MLQPADIAADTVGGRTLTLRRCFEVPRVLVWTAWTEADHMMRWLCPAGFTMLFAALSSQNRRSMEQGWKGALDQLWDYLANL